MTTTVRLLAALALLVTGLGASGCGGDEERTAPEVSTAVAGGDASASTLQADEAPIDLGKGLPEGFPDDDVPVLDGRVIGGSQGEDGGPYAWSVILKVDGDVDSVYAEVRKMLVASGYRTDPAMTMDAVHTGRFRGATYDVSVNAAQAGDAVTVTYLVRPPG